MWEGEPQAAVLDSQKAESVRRLLLRANACIGMAEDWRQKPSTTLLPVFGLRVYDWIEAFVPERNSATLVLPLIQM